MYLRTCSNSKPTVDTAYPRAQKCSPVKFRTLPHKRAIAMALFPFRNPITEATILDKLAQSYPSPRERHWIRSRSCVARRLE
jgi:hypothetical protein